MIFKLNLCSMKEGWEIVNIGSICNIITGKLDANVSSENGVYPFFTCSRESLKIDNYAYDCECVLIAGNGDLNVKYYKGKFNAYQRTYIVTLKNDIKNVSVKYIFKFFEKYVEKLRQLSVGGVIKYIKLGDLTNAKIPVPPLSEQEKIVAELDCLSGIIEKKKQQLKELDSLAQSIFYEMFGDPVENEKGWEVKKLGEIGELARGVSKHRPRNAPELLGGNIPLIQTGDISNANMYLKDYNYTYSELGLSQSRLWPSGTLCITIAATIGKCSILTFDSCFPDSIVGYIVNDNYTNNEYVYYIFGFLQKILEENAPAVAQKNINLKILNDLLIPLPPLSLQQQFANKIELIEKQKELIKQSIKETETLFDSRMDYYFNS